MKEQESTESLEDSKDFFEAGAVLPEEEFEPQVKANGSSKARLTELRRRIEERLDSKRIDLEFDYESLDDSSDKLQ